MKISVTLLFLILCLIFIDVNSQTLVDTRSKSIYPETNYSEPYRNQFHFSPKAGWMNDINGPFYYNGVYHMFYQHYPYGNQWANMHWGYATSTDLLHWKHHNPALVPGEDGNTNGMAYSGTAVIDSLNTSGLQTGKHPVFILPYTDTNEGQSLVYSNNLGKTWQRFKHNPVIAKPKADEKPMIRRDPKVFWYAPKNQWVMVVFREKIGMEFFTSKNLTDWQLKNVFNAEYFWECPDMFQMQVEGTQEKKWVLMAAIGAYCVGDFDGETFTKETEVKKMYLGPDIYAGQSFYNAPNNEIIQMAWLGMWNRKIPELNSNLWNHAATFPVELTLHKDEDNKYHIRRSPIRAISKLVTKTIDFNDVKLSEVENPLQNIGFKTYDLQFTIHLNETRQQNISLNISNKSIKINLKEHTIDGIKFTPQNNTVTIRILKDVACYELFINNGVASKAEEFPFNPKNNSIGFKLEFPLSIKHLSVKQLKSIWQSTN